jgi:DNA-binding HxlR family transcriptional regulator
MRSEGWYMNRQSVKTKKATCELEVAFGVMGGKWKPLILSFLGELGVLRFAQLEHLMPNVTHRILTKQLRELEEDNLIQRKVYAEVPPKVEYSITDIGKEALPILDMMCQWANKNNQFGYELAYNLCDDEIDKN